MIHVGDVMPSLPGHLVISKAEAEELMAYMQHQYVNPNTHPVLSELLRRLSDAVRNVDAERMVT